MQQELIPLNIIVADRNYRIKILPKDEEAVRKTIKIINDKIIDFRSRFAGRDMQDYISMVLVWFATQPQHTGESFEEDSIREGLEEIEKQIKEMVQI